MRWLVALACGACGRIDFTEIGDGGVGGDAGGITVGAAGGPSGGCPSLVSDGTGLAIAWIDGTTLRFRELAYDGTPRTAELAVSTIAQGLSAPCPTLLWVGSAYAIVWDEAPAGTDSIVITNITASGIKQGGDLVLATSVPLRYPRATWNGSQLGLAFAHYQGAGDQNYQIHHQLATLAGVASSDIQLGTMQSGTTTATIAQTTGGDAVVWYERSDSSLHYANATTVASVNLPIETGANDVAPPATILGSSQVIVYASSGSQMNPLVEVSVDPATGVAGTPRMLPVGGDPALASDGAQLGLAYAPGPWFLPLDLGGAPSSAATRLSGAGEAAAITGVPGGGFAVAWAENHAIQLVPHI